VIFYISFNKEAIIKTLWDRNEETKIYLLIHDTPSAWISLTLKKVIGSKWSILGSSSHEPGNLRVDRLVCQFLMVHTTNSIRHEFLSHYFLFFLLLSYLLTLCLCAIHSVKLDRFHKRSPVTNLLLIDPLPGKQSPRISTK